MCHNEHRYHEENLETKSFPLQFHFQTDTYLHENQLIARNVTEMILYIHWFLHSSPYNKIHLIDAVIIHQTYINLYLSGKQISIVWITAHVGILGNESTDRLTKHSNRKENNHWLLKFHFRNPKNVLQILSNNTGQIYLFLFCTMEGFCFFF